MREFLCVVVLAMGSCVVGCAEGVQPLWSTAKPETIVDMGPLHVHNSKDFYLRAKGLKVKTPKGLDVECDELEMGDNASAVRKANVEQTDAAARLTTEIGKPIIEALHVAGAVLPAYAPPASKPATPGPGEVLMRNITPAITGGAKVNVTSEVHP